MTTTTGNPDASQQEVKNLDALVQEKLDADIDFQASLEDMEEDEKTNAILAKKDELKNIEFARQVEYGKNQRIRAEKGERGEVKPKQEEKKEEGKNDTSLSPLDTLAIMRANVHEEDVEEVLKASKLLGKSISETLKDTTVQSILAGRNAERKTAEATATGSARAGSPKRTASDIVADVSKGNVPEAGSPEAEELFWARRGGRRSS